MKRQIKKYQHMNAQGTTTCGIIIDYTNKTFQYYPRQSWEVCCGIRLSKKKIEELKTKCLTDGFTEIPVRGYGLNVVVKEQEPTGIVNDLIANATERSNQTSVQTEPLKDYAKE